MNEHEVYPEITVQTLAENLKNNPKLVILDVRELWELAYAQLRDKRVVLLPMSRMAREQEEVFPPELRNHEETYIVVMCHHGVRSMQVTQWMRQLGWKNVFSLAGGIDAYAQEIDSSIGFY